MEDNQASTKKNNQLIQEESSIEALILKVKSITFQVLSVLLKNEEEDVLMLFAATAVDYMQMHAFPFHQKLNHVWKASTFLQYIFDVFNLFNIQNYMPRINFDTYIAGVYLLVFVILLIILDLLYVSYSFSQKKFSITWPLKILNQVTSYFVTVFFLPITETLISVLECQSDENGNLVHTNFSDVRCWQGWMLVHQIISSLFNLIFVIISSIVALTFFEPRMTSKNRTARQDSLAEVVFIITKVLCQVLFNFVPSGSDWFLVLLTFILSVGLYWAYNFEEPYYDKEVGQFFNIVTTYYLWTNFMLLISLIFYNTSFNGGLIIWILGIPFIIFIMVTTKKSKIDTLIRSQMKFRSGEQVQGHLRYVLTLIENQKKDRNSYMLLIGYVEKHKEICQEEDCPLKIKKTRRGKQTDIEIEEVIKNLLKELGRLYQNGLKKFPTCTKLRLSYAFFLLERLKKREEALTQFKMSMTTKPTFDEQFIIYRYIELISSNQEELDDEDEEENDVVKKIEFDSHMSQCEEYMKLAAIKHKEFWANLKEDNNIALGRLNILGSGISLCVYRAKDHFARMIKINSTYPQPFRVYGQFLIRVLNQKEAGLEMIEKSRELVEQADHKNQKKEDLDDFKNDPRPYIITQKRKTAFTTIQNINLLFSVLFAYQRDEIIGKDLSFILPNLYVPYHESLVEQLQDNINQANYQSLYLNNPQSRFGKNRSGYIFPIIYNVRPLTEDFSKFCVTLEADLQTKSSIFLLTNEHFQITDISSSAISHFDLTSSILKKEASQLVISTIISDWEQEKENYFNKGKEFTFNQQPFFCTLSKLVIPIEIKDAFDDEDQYNFETIGYQFKIEKLEKPNSGNFQNGVSNPNVQNAGQSSSNSQPDSKTPQLVLQGPSSNNSNNSFNYFPPNSAKESNNNSYSMQYIQTLNSPSTNNNSNIFSTYNLPTSTQNLVAEQSSSRNISNNYNNPSSQISKLGINQNNGNNNKYYTDSLGIIQKQQGSQRNIQIKQKNLDDSDIEMIPIILVDQKKLESNNLSDNEIMSQHQMLGGEQKVNQLSKFIFDFYKTPVNDDSFGDEQTSSYTFNNRDQSDYGQGIKTKRLFNNQLMNIYEDNIMDEESEEKKNEDSVFNNNNEERYKSKEEYQVFNQANTSQIITKSLNFNYDHFSVKLFKYISLLWLMIVLGVSIFEYVYSAQQLSDYSDYIDTIQIIAERNSACTHLVSNSIDLILVSQNKFATGYVTLDSLKAEINSIIQKTSNLTQTIKNQEYNYIDIDHNLYDVNFYKGKLSDTFSIQKLESQNFINLLISLNAILANQEASYLTLNNGHLNTIIYNYYDQFNAYLNKQAEDLSSNIKGYLASTQLGLIIALIVLGVLSSVSMVILMFLTIYIKDQRENILFLFLDIPLKHVDYLYRHCDYFLKKFVSIQELIKKNENQGYESSDEEEEEKTENFNVFMHTKNDIQEDEMETQEEIMKKRLKIIKSYKKKKFKGQKGMVLKYIIIIILSLVFAVINIVTMVTTKENLKFLWDQYAYDLQIVLNLGNNLNVQKIMLLDPTYPISGLTAQEFTIKNFKNVLGRNSLLTDFNFEIINNNQIEIRDLYLKIFYQNSCQQLEQNINECEKLIEGNIKIGIDNVIQFFFIFFQNNINYLIESVDPDEILKKSDMVEANLALYKFIEPIMEAFTNQENNIIDNDIASTKSLQTLLLILFIFVLISSYLILWLPKISSMNIEINRTISMLDMIPLKVMKENRNIRVFIKQLIDESRKNMNDII